MRRTTASFVLFVVMLTAIWTALAGSPPATAHPFAPGYCVEVHPTWPDEEGPWARVCMPW